METRDPSGIDRIISERILARRNAPGMSQPELAQRAGVAFQQVQKHENGNNRVSAGRPHFGLPPAINSHPDCRAAAAEGQSKYVGPDTGEALELLRAFRRIPQAGTRRVAIGLAKKQALPPPGSDARGATRKRQAQASPGLR
jgi:hypothetical protein